MSYYSATAAVTVDLVAGTNSDGDSYTSIEAVTGSTFNDTITGGTGQAWTIDGGAGDDVVVANAANTVLMGGAGADTITGFSGVETAAYWNSTAGVTVSLSTGTGTGGDAQGDVLSAINNLEGSGHGDSLTGDANANKLSGLDGNDYLHGGDGNDSLLGGNGSDTLNGGNGIDTIDGGAGGLDWVSYADAGQAVDVRLHSNYGGWTGNVDSITGIEGIRGSAYADTLYGRDVTDDWFEGGAGADDIWGYTGNDTVVYWSSAAGVSLTLAEGSTYAIGSGGDSQGDKVATVENIEGSAYGDNLGGNTGANRLAGLDGNDTLNGWAGNDTLEGGNGSDTLIGGDGNDILTGGAGNDSLYGGTGGAGTSQGGGIDRAVFSGVSTDYQITVTGDTITVTDLNTADGDDGTDVLNSVEQITFSNTTLSYQTITGTFGNDNLTGTNRDETITGGTGNDTIDGGAGADTIDGGDGFDWLNYSNAGQAVDVRLHSNYGGWTNNVDSVTGFEGIRGSAYADTLYGRDVTDDWFEGGAGADDIWGYTGNDTVVYWSSSAGVSLTLGDGVASTFGTGGDAQGDRVTLVENVEGSAYGDTLGGNSGANRLAGLGGNDTLSGGGGADTVDGGDGNDSILGGNGADTLIGGAGNDTIFGDVVVSGAAQGSGLDRVVYGGVSTDYQVTVSGDTITVTDLNTADGDDGTDVLAGVEQIAFSNTTLSYQAVNGTSGNDGLTGTSRDETISGGDGNDTLNGGAGADTINGGAGIDWVSYANIGQAVDVRLHASSGGWTDNVDTLNSIEGIRGSAYADILYGQDVADDWFEGGAGADDIWGYTGNDTVVYWSSSAGVSLTLGDGVASTFGTGGDAQGDRVTLVENVEGSAHGDTLGGNSGANRLAGLGGNDTLNGGAGIDTLDGGAGNDSLTGGAGSDLYLQRRGDGIDTVVQAGISDASTTTDTLRFASGVAYDQLWFRQSGNDLLIDVIGEASSQTVVKDWYSDTTRRVDVIETEDGSHSLTAANVQALVSAMASYSLPSVGTYVLDSGTHSALDTTFASTWS